MKIKNILLTIFLFFIISMPVFASEANNIFIPDITKDQAKKAIIGRALTTNWQVKNDSEYTLDIYRIKNDAASMMLYGTGFNMHPEERVHFNLLEKNSGITISYTANIATNPNSGYEKLESTPLLSFAVNEMLKELFIGNYAYNIKYKIKKEHILISDTPQTSYADNNRIGSEYKTAIKINDKKINEYKKPELKALFNKCEKDQIKIEVNDDTGAHTYYLNRTYTAPTYKQYL